MAELVAVRLLGLHPVLVVEGSVVVGTTHQDSRPSTQQVALGTTNTISATGMHQGCLAGLPLSKMIL